MGKSKYNSTDSCESSSTDSSETSSDESSDAVTEVQRMKNTKKKRLLAFHGLTQVQVILISLVLSIIILAITVGIILFVAVTAESLPDETQCEGDNRTFHSTIEGFRARSNHIPDCLQTCGNENTLPEKEEKIINGKTPNINSWPFLVKLHFISGTKAQLCGGTILNSRSRSLTIGQMIANHVMHSKW